MTTMLCYYMGYKDLLENEAADVGYVVDLSTVGKTYMSVYKSLDKLTLGCTCTCMSTSVQQGNLINLASISMFINWAG